MLVPTPQHLYMTVIETAKTNFTTYSSCIQLFLKALQHDPDMHIAYNVVGKLGRNWNYTTIIMCCKHTAPPREGCKDNRLVRGND